MKHNLITYIAVNEVGYNWITCYRTAICGLKKEVIM